MEKYNDLVSILDRLCEEAPIENVRYHAEEGNVQKQEQARSRAYIHLYLKVKFGLLQFQEREHFITDGSNDGGIDAYYIDTESRTVYFIQSKFRNKEQNFSSKEISYEELLSMDVERVLRGNEQDEFGNNYNGKILQLQREVSAINDLARYDYKVIILANLRDKIRSKLTRLVGVYDVEVFDAERVYNELVFSVVSGTFYNPKELCITLAVNRESASSRIQYYPKTEYGECTVNVLFVPTKEIGRILYQYKNSILKYNPRSYLELRTGSVNEKIQLSITSKTTNEFALFNNGITMLSDETAYNDTVGRKNTAQLLLTNPQIINGGQSAYTLSRIYEDCLITGDFHVFDGKEVLLKVISFNDDADYSLSERLMLIEAISTATNQQSPVSEADRRANDKVQVELQQLFFDHFGLYYERKRGEYSDGIKNKYISRDKIIDREGFIRCCLAIEEPVKARQRSADVLFRKAEFNRILPDASNYRKWMFAYLTYQMLTPAYMSKQGLKFYAKHAVVCVVCHQFGEELSDSEFGNKISEVLSNVVGCWADFENSIRNLEGNVNRYFVESIDETTGEKQVDANWQGYYKGRTLLRDLRCYFGF